MCVPCDNGILNIRVGAIILRDGQILMAGNSRNDYLYSVGGRIKFGETAEDAVIREVYEETGVHMEIDRLGFVQENYFYGNDPSNAGKLIYEIAFYFYMKTPANFTPYNNTFFEENGEEYLKWVSPDSDNKIFPTFFKTELCNPSNTVKYFVNDER